MDVVVAPGCEEIGLMSAAVLDELGAGLEVSRRVAEAGMASLLQRVDACGAFGLDGHRRASLWGRATNNWSGAEAARLAKLGRAFVLLPLFAEAALAGRVGIAQMHAVAAVAANPRVREYLGAADESLTRFAQTLGFDDLVTYVQHWEQLADGDGARSRDDRAVELRRARLAIVDERCFLDAAGSAFDGVVIRQVLDAYREVEWRDEWEQGVAEHGEAMCPALMPRSDAQRSFDALRRVFDNAARANECGVDTVVNIVIDEATFEQHLQEALGGEAEPLPAEHAAVRRCEDDRGTVIDPRAAIAAALVGQVRRMVVAADGVVVDFGHRKRLFSGALREAVLLSNRWCAWVGCDRPAWACAADHVLPHARHGPTTSRNGGPLCDHHNLAKNRGFRTWRDPEGFWHTYRPDGTE